MQVLAISVIQGETVIGTDEAAVAAAFLVADEGEMSVGGRVAVWSNWACFRELLLVTDIVTKVRLG